MWNPSLIGNLPALCLEYAKQSNELFKHPLCFFVGQVSRSRKDHYKPGQKLWCLGLNIRSDAFIGLQKSNVLYPGLECSLLGHSVTVQDTLLLAGSRGTRVLLVSLEIGHWAFELVKKTVDILALTGTGRLQTYRVYTNIASAVFDKVTETVRTAASEDSVNRAAQPDRLVSVLSKTDMQIEFSALPRDARRIITMVNQLAIVDREALYLALMLRRGSFSTSVLVKSNTLRRFLSQMVADGEFKKTCLQYDNGVLSVLLDPSIDHDGPKTLKFATNQAKVAQKPHKCKRIIESRNCYDQRRGRGMLARQAGGELGVSKHQPWEKIAEINMNFHFVLQRLALSSIPAQTSILSGALTVPFARHMIKVLIDREPIGFEMGSSVAGLCASHFKPERSCIPQLLLCAWSLATSRLFRQGWVKISDRSFLSSNIVASENIIWCCDLLISRFGAITFLIAAKVMQRADHHSRYVPSELKGPNFTVNTPGGVHAFHLLAISRSCRTAMACPAMSGPWHASSCDTGHCRPTFYEGSMPRHGQNVNRLFQVIISYYELWKTLNMKFHAPFGPAFDCITFMHCLFRSGTSVGVVVMDRSYTLCKPNFDYLETTALLLDLCNRGTLRVDCSLPGVTRRVLLPKRIRLTIFDVQYVKEHTYDSVLSQKIVPIQYAVLALQGNVRIKTPVFFANHVAYDRILA